MAAFLTACDNVSMTEEGVFAGTSSALNITAALQLARELGPGNVVATVAVDTGLKYLAGDLFVDI